MDWLSIVRIALQILPGILPQGNPVASSVVGAVIAYDHDTVKWLQGSLNNILKLNPPLQVDGIMGPKTRAAIMKAEDHFGLPSNGALGRGLILAVEAAVRGVPHT